MKFHDSVISAMFLFEIKIFMNFLAGMVYCFVEIFANLYKFTICVASVGMALVLCVTNCCWRFWCELFVSEVLWLSGLLACDLKLPLVTGWAGKVWTFLFGLVSLSIWLLALSFWLVLPDMLSLSRRGWWLLLSLELDFRWTKLVCWLE